MVALIPSLFVARLEILTTSNWHSLGTNGSEVSLAGWWFNLVSAPLFRFLLLRWGWRMLLWTSFMWRVSRLDLHLSATHTDMAAGLGFLSEGQRAFGPIVFAGGTVIAGQVGNAIAYEGATLSSVQYHMIAYGILAILVLVVPLLAVAPRLVDVKKKALLDFGALVTEHAQLFDAKWNRADRPSGEVILGNPDASSLADLGGSFAVVRAMRVVPSTSDTRHPADRSGVSDASGRWYSPRQLMSSLEPSSGCWGEAAPASNCSHGNATRQRVDRRSSDEE